MTLLEETVAAAASARAAIEARREIRDEKRIFYSSRLWRALRYRALKENASRHGGVPTCEVCAARRGPGAVMHVDHSEPLSKNWDRRLDPTNVQIMCDDCNLGKGNRDQIDWRAPVEYVAAG